MQRLRRRGLTWVPGFPGCAARPRALRYNAFGVKTIPHALPAPQSATVRKDPVTPPTLVMVTDDGPPGNGSRRGPPHGMTPRPASAAPHRPVPNPVTER